MSRAEAVLAAELELQRERLQPCVHCGFCLPACPTYTRLGDEADSPRGRLHLMGAVVEGRLDPASDAFRTHIDRCLGCRACEPVCPSGVEYGSLLELARDVAAYHRPQEPLTRALLAVLGSRVGRALFFAGGRFLRATGLASLGARALPDWPILRGARLGLAMLASSVRWRGLGWRRAVPADSVVRAAPVDTVAEATEEHVYTPLARDGDTPLDADPAELESEGNVPRRGRVAILRGCVQHGLYRRVNEAAERALRANGYEVVGIDGQTCCGALHAHGGALEGARRLARENVAAFGSAELDAVVVTAAGCGAVMKEYGGLLAVGGEGGDAEAGTELAERVRDVTELLAEAGPRRGAPVRAVVAYDHPCHLLHAQGVEEPPLRVLAAVPGVEVRVVERADECCGGAGIYGITHPGLGGRIGRDKVAAVRGADAEVLATPNPGCMMQIGAGLRIEGSDEGVIHPVELLDESYRRAGYYEGGGP